MFKISPNEFILKPEYFNHLSIWIIYAAVNSSVVPGRCLRVNVPCAENTVLLCRLSVILHQRPPGHSHKEVQANASVRAAFVHALGDLFQSISVLTSALIIYFKVCMFVLTHCHSDFIYQGV